MLRRLSLIVLLGSLSAAYADNPSALTAQLDRVAASTTLYAPTLKPWHLKVAFTLFDEDGKNPRTGTFEEWWASPDQDRITYTSPAFSGTLLTTDGGHFSTPGSGSVPFALETLHNYIVHPLPAELHSPTQVPSLNQVAFGKVKLDCITLAPQSVSVPRGLTGLYPTFCFNPGTDELRFTTRFVNESVIRNARGAFQGQTVAVGLTVMEGAVIHAQGKVTTLETMPVSAMDFSSTGLESNRPAAKVAGGVIAGSLLHNFQPAYPESAKLRRAQGNVVLHVTIGTDGHVRQIQVISTPANDLAIAAIGAVRRWIYEPFLLNGKVVEVDTTVIVSFHIG